MTAEYLDQYTPKRLATFGLAITHLVVTGVRTGAGAKTVLEFGLDRALSQEDADIATGQIRVGDIVRVLAAHVDGTVDGVVTRIGPAKVHVLVSAADDDDTVVAMYTNTAHDNARATLVKLTNLATYKRMLQAVRRLGQMADADCGGVLGLLLPQEDTVLAGKKAPSRPADGLSLAGLSLTQDQERSDKDSAGTDATSASTKALGRLGKARREKLAKPGKLLTLAPLSGPALNGSQLAAIEFALKSPVAIVHGPPGTGKTQTLVELVRRLPSERVLVCAASNIAVDNFVERLNLPRGKAVRIGHPARVLPQVVEHSLDVLARAPDGMLLDVSKELSQTLAAVKKAKRYADRRALYADIKALRQELRTRELKVTRDLLVGANVVLATLHGLGAQDLYNIYKEPGPTGEMYGPGHPFFDTIIIDEFSQALEPQCWIALVNHLGCRRLVLAGDNKQLPATVDSVEAARKLAAAGENVADLSQTLFDRLMADLDGDRFRVMLAVQYRMNQTIMEFPLRTFYENRLTAAPANADILLKDLPDVEATEETEAPLIWYDTQGGEFLEQTDDDSPALGKTILEPAASKCNELEAAVVAQHVLLLVGAGVSPAHIGVISPYSAQVGILRRKLTARWPAIEVATVDGFQGREKEAIVLLLVRSNDRREVGFLNDPRRLNVAMTRPKRQLCVVGDIDLLQQSRVPFLAEWASYAEATFDLRYPDPSELVEFQ